MALFVVHVFKMVILSQTRSYMKSEHSTKHLPAKFVRIISSAVLNQLHGPEFTFSRYLIDKGISSCSGTSKPVNYACMWNRQYRDTWTALFNVATYLSCFLPPSFCISRYGSEHILTSLCWADRKLTNLFTSLHSTGPFVYPMNTLSGPLFAAGRTIH
jgi:hypothetical protein